jgi:hypothetical protein
MTTNITKEHRAAFEALISAGCGNFALFSCFVSGEPAAAIVAVTRDGEAYTISPLFVALTPGMVLTDIDSAYRVARAAAAGVDGLAVGSQTLIKRLHKSGRLKSIDERREKLKIRRVIDGRRLEVLHLPADVLEHSIVEKPAQSAH